MRLASILVALAAMQTLACGNPSEPVRDDAAEPSSASPASKDAGSSKPTVRGDASTRSDARAAESPPLSERDAESAPVSPARDAGPTMSPTTPNDAGLPPTPTASGCGSAKRNDRPFGCRFAWGTNAPETPVPAYRELAFISKWVGWEIDKNGASATCEGCKWLTTDFASTAAVPVYYAYFIGYLGSANGFADQNVNPSGPNLATDGAKLIRDRRAQIVEMYASYARKTSEAWPDKPLVWLLEGDFVQYTYKEQKSALSLAELGELARDITCAIKGNMPNAVVAINHSTWLSDEVTNGFWSAMNMADYDLVWTTGVANNRGFFESNADDNIYNKATATYAYVAGKTQRKIFVDTSFGLSEMSDTWASAAAATLNERIADGVIAANVTKPSANYVERAKSLSSQLSAVCQ